SHPRDALHGVEQTDRQSLDDAVGESLVDDDLHLSVMTRPCEGESAGRSRRFEWVVGDGRRTGDDVESRAYELAREECVLPAEQAERSVESDACFPDLGQIEQQIS